MGEPEGKEGLEYEAANFFRLGTLLQKERSELKARLVVSVLHESISTVEKIQRINAIDLKPEEELKPENLPRNRKSATIIATPATRKAANPVPVQSDEASGAETVQTAHQEQAQVRRSRLRYSRKPEPGGLLHYLFSEHRIIRNFGMHSQTLEKAGMPFILRLAPAVEAYVNQNLIREIAPIILQGTGLLLRKAWMVLEKEDYNLLAGLHSLAEQVLALDFKLGKQDTSSYLSTFAAISPLVLTFCSKRELPERVVRVWELANEKLAISDPSRARGPTYIRQLLSIDNAGISLINIIRALWMLKVHRYIDYTDLVPKNHGGLFGRDSYDCTLEIQETIDHYVQQLLSRLAGLEQERIEIERLRFYMPRPVVRDKFVVGPSLDFSFLEAFYNGSILHSDYKHSVDRETLLVWTIRFLDVFLENIGPLLGTGLRLQALGPVEIFQKGVLSSFTVRLTSMQEILKRYPLTARTTDVKALEDIAETARIMTSLGKTIIDLIRNRSVLADPICRAESRDGPAYPIPNENELIGLPDMLGGKTVIDALVMGGRISLLTGFFLGDFEYAALLEREAPLRQQAQETRAKLNQIARSAQMIEIETTYAALWALPPVPNPVISN